MGSAVEIPGVAAPPGAAVCIVASCARSALPRAIWRGDPDGTLPRVLVGASHPAAPERRINRRGLDP